MKNPIPLLLLAATTTASAATVEPWPLPSEGWAAQPNITAAADGALHLSWIEKREDGHALRHVRHDGAGFGPVHTAARGGDWFVNWADFPSLAVLPNGDLVGFVLPRSGDAPYAYDVAMLRSTDGGASWSEPALLHDDGTATEHGFVSLLPWRDDLVLVAWLDGRNTAGGQHGHGGGAMSLRAALVGRDGKHGEWPLDERTCDCCQTALARSGGAAVLVFRDRDGEEIRDIAASRFDGSGWSEPVPVHADRWTMPACPVNGPAVAARGDEVHVAWYTAAGGEPQLKLARSDDAGAAFGAPRTIAAGAAVQGRVDVGRLGDSVLVSWVGEEAGVQTIWLSRFDAGLLEERERVAVARPGRGRGTGFPRLAVRDGQVHVVYTAIAGGEPQVRAAKVSFD